MDERESDILLFVLAWPATLSTLYSATTFLPLLFTTSELLSDDATARREQRIVFHRRQAKRPDYARAFFRERGDFYAH